MTTNVWKMAETIMAPLWQDRERPKMLCRVVKSATGSTGALWETNGQYAGC